MVNHRNSTVVAILLACLATGSLFPNLTFPAVLHVGPSSKYTKPSEVASIAKDGDIIHIAGGTYRNDATVWHQDNLTIKGIGGRPHLIANGTSAEGKAIWVMKGKNTTIENIEFSGARVQDGNGAAIRQEGKNLIVRYCFFHDNENGILTGRNEESHIVIEHSEFAHNVGRKGFTHNIYIGQVKRFTLQYSLVHHAEIGHNVKSRARENHILYNMIRDGHSGTSSYLVDLSNGGTAYIVGNILQQGKETTNPTLIAFAPEGTQGIGMHPSQGLFVINNTFTNHYSTGTYIRNWSRTPATIANNIFATQDDTILSGKGSIMNNLITDESTFVDASSFNYRLLPSSRAIDQGITVKSPIGYPLVPKWQYLPIASKEPRPTVGVIDLGAYEFTN